ncbi:hypothetical protein MBLNU459_g1983t1 [Dothideomycetes sp. NU459]
MHAQNFLVASTVLLPVLVQAHGGGIPGAPKIFGRRSALQDKAFQAVRDRSERAQPYGEPPNEHTDLKRQASTNTGGQCGPSYGSCADGYCCSEAGWCGSGTSYCMSPVEGTIAVTFDDGPYIYTDYILDVLANYSAKATFFVTGNNNGKGEIDNAANPWATVIKRAYNEGHQIASHTWTHPYLSNLTSLQRRQQMWSNEMALRNVLGFFPTYMRPPYSDCTAASGCESDMAELGYHITYFDVDTDDYANDSPLLIQNAKNNFNAGIAGGSPSTSDYLVIAHDIHNQTAHNLTAYMLQTLLAQGYKPVTVGECLGDPEANWYRNSSGSVFTSTTAIATSTTAIKSTVAPTATSTDATCGGSSGFTCSNSAFGNCCSASGCGDDHYHQISITVDIEIVIVIDVFCCRFSNSSVDRCKLWWYDRLHVSRINVWKLLQQIWFLWVHKCVLRYRLPIRIRHLRSVFCVKLIKFGSCHADICYECFCQQSSEHDIKKGSHIIDIHQDQQQDDEYLDIGQDHSHCQNGCHLNAARSTVHTTSSRKAKKPSFLSILHLPE